MLGPNRYPDGRAKVSGVFGDISGDGNWDRHFYRDGDVSSGAAGRIMRSVARIFRSQTCPKNVFRSQQNAYNFQHCWQNGESTSLPAKALHLIRER
jgi:hypothetical protein